MSDSGYPRFWNLNSGIVNVRPYRYFFFCMRLISLRYQENYVWPSLKCHTPPPPDPWGRVSLSRALHGLCGENE